MKGLVTVGKSGSGNEVMGMGTLITKKKKRKGKGNSYHKKNKQQKNKTYITISNRKKEDIFSEKKITHALLVIIETERTMPPQKVEK